MELNRRILWIPIWVGLAFIIFNYLFVTIFQGAFTDTADKLLRERKGEMVMASFLFLFPNFLLTFLLFTFMKTSAQSNAELYTLCYSGVIGGLIPQFLLYGFFFSEWLEYGAHLPVMLFGFPFIYLVGMMIGWVFGLFLIFLRRS